MKGSKRSEGGRHEPAVPVTGRQEDSSGKAGQKNANENITYRRRRGMISVGLDLHKKTAQIAAMDKDGTVLFNRKIPHTREAIKAEVDRLPKQVLLQTRLMDSIPIRSGLDTLCYSSGLHTTISLPRMMNFRPAGLFSLTRIGLGM